MTRSGLVFDAYFPDGTRRPGGSFPIRLAGDSVLAMNTPVDPEAEAARKYEADPERTNPPAPTLDDDRIREIAAFLRDKLSDKDFAAVLQMLNEAMAQDDPPPFPGMPKTGGTMAPLNRKKETTAMDYSIARQIAMDEAERRAVRTMTEIRAAEAAVAPYVGPTMGCDSVSAVYRAALERLGHNTASLHPTACKATFDAVKTVHRNARASAYSPKGLFDRFPEARRIGF